MWVTTAYQVNLERDNAHYDAVLHCQSLARTLSEHSSHILRQTEHATQLFKLKYEETGGALRLPEFTRPAVCSIRCCRPSWTCPSCCSTRTASRSTCSTASSRRTSASRPSSRRWPTTTRTRRWSPRQSSSRAPRSG